MDLEKDGQHKMIPLHDLNAAKEGTRVMTQGTEAGGLWFVKREPVKGDAWFGDGNSVIGTGLLSRLAVNMEEFDGLQRTLT